jgi:hypothetical protein
MAPGVSSSGGKHLRHAKTNTARASGDERHLALGIALR